MASYGIEVGNGHDALIQKNCESPAENEMGSSGTEPGFLTPRHECTGKIGHKTNLGVAKLTTD